MPDARYAHIVAGAREGLDCATCCLIEDVACSASLDSAWSAMTAFFDASSEHVARVTYRLCSEDRSRRVSRRSFEREFVRHGAALQATDFSNISLSSRGISGDASTATWAPIVLAEFTLSGRVWNAFFSTAKKQILSMCDFAPFWADWLAPSDISAAYVFDYPLAFSSPAYASGIIYQPASRRLYGEIEDDSAARITNWRNHCARGRRAAEGYLRDVYRENFLGARHLQRRIHGATLQHWVEQEAIGTLSGLLGGTLWTLSVEQLAEVQSELDSGRVLLGSFPP